MADRSPVTIEDARRDLTAAVGVIDEYDVVKLNEAYGRITGEDIFASIAVPHFPKSAMDGYAVRSCDIVTATADHPVILKVLAEFLPGDDVSGAFPPDADAYMTAVRIMTGAMIPSCYDTIIRQEDSDYGVEEVKIYKSQDAYINYCKIGEDIENGEKVISKGTRLGRFELGVLASLGITEVKVLRKIRVAIISTGSELISPGDILEPGKIYNSLRISLEASLKAYPVEVDRSTIIDDKDLIEEALSEALARNDIVITTGGVSVGRSDHLPAVLQNIGAKRIFAGVDVKPGTPTIGSVKDGKVILSLSGNPYAAIANYDIYIGAVIARLSACRFYEPQVREGIMAGEYKKTQNIRRLIRARYEDGRIFLPKDKDRSSVLSSLMGLNCYIDLAPGIAAHEGDKVKVIMMPGGGEL